MPEPRLSRYEFAPVYQDSKGRTFLGVPDPISQDVLHRGAVRHHVKASDTLHSIAWQYYESLLDPEQDIRPTSFFDLVGTSNQVIDPSAPLPAGKIFLVPTIEVLQGDVRVPPPFSGVNQAN